MVNVRIERLRLRVSGLSPDEARRLAELVGHGLHLLRPPAGHRDPGPERDEVPGHARTDARAPASDQHGRSRQFPHACAFLS